MIRPGYTPIIGIDELDGKTFIVIWCPGGDSRPYSSPKTMSKKDTERFNFIRKGSVTVNPNDDEVKELFALANKTPFDDRVNHTAEISDLNYTLVKSYLKEIESDLYDRADKMDFIELCKDMNLISTLPEYVKPKNVALMFFNPEPEKFFPCAQIDVVQFPEGEGGDKIIEQTFRGPLHEQLRAALRYIRNVIITEQIVKRPDKAEADRFFNYPYEAIEEALSNAVYHKAYDEREPIEVRVEKDMIEIISHPGPDRSVTLEGLRTFKVRSRRYRNRRIGEILKELHLTEGRNTGFRKILKALEKNGSPLPEFETDEAHDYFITRLYVRDGFYDYQKKIDASIAEENPKDTQENPKETATDNPKETAAENPKETAADNPKENPKETVAENPKENPKETTTDSLNNPKETGTVNQKENPKENPKETVSKNPKETAAETPEETPRKMILRALKENMTLTVREISYHTGLTNDAVRYHMDKMRKEGILKRIGSTKDGKWIISRKALQAL